MHGALLEGPWRDDNIILSEEGTGIEVDRCMVVEFNGDFRQLVLL